MMKCAQSVDNIRFYQFKQIWLTIASSGWTCNEDNQATVASITWLRGVDVSSNVDSSNKLVI